MARHKDDSTFPLLHHRTVAKGHQKRNINEIKNTTFKLQFKKDNYRKRKRSVNKGNIFYELPPVIAVTAFVAAAVVATTDSVNVAVVVYVWLMFVVI